MLELLFTQTAQNVFSFTAQNIADKLSLSYLQWAELDNFTIGLRSILNQLVCDQSLWARGGGRAGMTPSVPPTNPFCFTHPLFQDDYGKIPERRCKYRKILIFEPVFLNHVTLSVLRAEKIRALSLASFIMFFICDPERV